MLWTIFVILLVLWLLGIVSSRWSYWFCSWFPAADRFFDDHRSGCMFEPRDGHNGVPHKQIQINIHGGGR